MSFGVAIDLIFQAIIFIIKREFMLVGWMVVYILSYVYLLFCGGLLKTYTILLQLSNIQFLPACIFLLVHGRIWLG